MTGTAQNEAVDAAQRTLADDGVVQLDLPAFAPPKVPDWWRSFGEWLARHWPDIPAPAWRVLRYCLLAALAALALVALYQLWQWWRGRARRAAALDPADTSAWRPQAAAARALLADADRLAAEARFAEAAHLLLLRSVDQIAARHPEAVRPALTSRDIARQPGLTADVRGAFTLIAGFVERSLFGGADLDAAGWTRCRTAYADAAFGRAWT